MYPLATGKNVEKNNKEVTNVINVKNKTKNNGIICCKTKKKLIAPRGLFMSTEQM
jgi:hypothetical protein